MTTPHPAITATGSRLILGPPGSGKSTLLLHAAAHAVAQGALPQRVAIITFAYRSTQYLRQLLTTLHPQLATTALQLLTLRDLAANALTHQHLQFISNNDVRKLLRQLIASQGFAGTLNEAEHIIRAAKSRAKRLPEADPHYPLVAAYKAALDERQLTDRHDIIRQHIRSMKDGTAQPAAVDMILIDNLQDATELQLIWLKEHHLRSIPIVATGCDDTTAFARDGALGQIALETFANWPAAGGHPVTTHTLTDHYRTPSSLAPAVTKVARFLRQRSGLTVGEAHNTTPATLTIQSFPDRQAEHAWLIKTLKNTNLQGLQLPIGVVTRFDQSAQHLTHIFRKNGLATGSYARLVWEEPAAQLVLALLHLLMNTATTQQLAMVLVGHGIPAEVVQDWLKQGLQGANFLPNNAQLPTTPNPSPTTVDAIAGAQTFFRMAWQSLSQRLNDPREVFQAAMQRLLFILPPTEHADAILAADTLLSLTGNLTDILTRVTTETLPPANSPIIVAPVREVRNHTFSTLILPHANSTHWPAPPFKVLGEDPDHERRLFYLALTRSAGHLIVTHTGTLSPLVAELQQGLRTTTRLG